MARLRAKESMLYFPTPPRVVFLISSNLIPSSGGTIFDPCCGTGEALVTLGSHLNLTTYGNELDPKRFTEAEAQVGHCLNGAREFLQIEGQFSCLFNNPPYDIELEGQRMEYSQLQQDMELLMPGGLGIWILPESAFDYNLCTLLINSLSDLAIRRFPEPEFEQFKQVVILGYRRTMPPSYTYGEALELEKNIKSAMPPLVEGEFSYQPPEQSSIISSFDLKFPDTGQVLAEIETDGIQTSEAWQHLLGYSGSGIEDFQPVLGLTSGHAAMAIAAGIVDGTEIEIEGDPYIIKGSSHKAITVSKQAEAVGEGTQTTIREREILVQTISAFNLENGSLQEYNSKDDHNGFSQFLITHQQELVDTIDRRYPPLFEPERDMPAWTKQLNLVKAPGKLPGQQHIGGLLPAQQVRAAALAEKLKTDKSVVLVGEMGSGKSCVSAAIAALIGNGNFKTVIVAPSNIVKKWKREASNVLVNFGVSVHIIGEKRKQADGNGKIRKVSKPILDVIAAMKEPAPSILVMSYETAKNGARWEHAVSTIKKPVKKRVEEVEIVKQNHYPYEREMRVEKVVTKMQSVLSCPDCGEIICDDAGPLLTIKDLGKRKRFCRECSGALWQQTPFKYGGRVAVADFMNKHYSGRFNLIIDECHYAKGSNTDMGFAVTDLISAAYKVIAMTGTLYAGKASSIFHLLYRLFPHFRQLYAHTDVQRFIQLHGLIETLTTVKSSKQWTSAFGYSRQNVRIRELPGVSPGMVAMLLNNTVFLKLADMGLEMPSYTEERYPIPLDYRLEAGIEDLERIYDKAKELARLNQPGLLSQWLYASLGWMDNPVDEDLTEKDEDGEIVVKHPISGVLSSNDELLDEPLAKDEALLEIIESELAQGRGVGTFFAQVNRRDWMTRIQKLLQQNGIYSEILRQNTCKPEDREAWYFEFVKRCRAMGQEPVLLANGSLLKEGLDLIELPTIVETGIEYKINDLRQRDRRAWRLTQDQPCKVVFLYYEDSMQETALRLISAKLKAALMVDGNLADGLASMDLEDGDLMNALMKAVSRGKRQQKMEWAGMEVASITPVEEAEAIIEEVFVTAEEVAEGAEDIDVVFGDLPLFTQDGDQPQAQTVNKPKRKGKKQANNTVEVAQGVIQYSLFG